MAKTNSYSSRQASALAFEEAEPRPALAGRVRGRARDRVDTSSQLPFEDDVVLEEEERELLPEARRRLRAGRVPVHKGRLEARNARMRGSRFWWFLLRTRIGLALSALVLLAGAAAAVFAYRQVRSFLEHDSHFRIASSASIKIVGATELTPAELLSVFGGDLGRNIFFVPLVKRQAELEQVPWVAHATVMRLLPDQLRVSIVERVPIAFVRLGSAVALIDADGVILHLPPATLALRHYSFPVVTGIGSNDPPFARATRMRLYQRFVRALDAGGRSISSQLSEVDLTDMEDVRALVPEQGADLLLHFGDSDFAARYQSFQAHLSEWRQQYPHLSAIDLRYDRQVVLKMADGKENEASSIDRGSSLTAAPEPSANHASATLPANRLPGTHRAEATHHTAGHGAAHGWKPL